MFTSNVTFNDFLAVVKLLYQEGEVLGADYIKQHELDPLKYGTSFLLYEVTNELIKNYRTEVW